MAELGGTGRADLHLHSTASDGLATPDELAQAVRAAGIRTAALTDHDTTAGCAPFAAAARPLGLRAIAGAEIAAEDEGEEVHLLAYFASPPSAEFASLLARLAGERRGRAEEMLRRLAAIGIEVEDAASILAHPQVGRPHVARALVRMGAAADTADAFQRYLVPGRAAFVDRWRPTAADAIQRAHAEGGIVSLAHPGLYEKEHLTALAAAGLDGVEANHPSATHHRRQALRRTARGLGLVVTGGSDFHGNAGTRPGDAGLGPADSRRFLDRLYGA